MKKVFGDKINGPITQREREFQISSSKDNLVDIIKFLKNRNVTNLIAINAWKAENDIKIAYQFITQFGKKFLDSKISLIIFIKKNELTCPSIKKIYSNSILFEEDITIQYKVKFSE